MSPEPDAVHDPSTAAARPRDAEQRRRDRTSVTVASTTSDGPAFDTTIVYDTGVPGTSDDTPSDFVTDRSATATMSVVSVDVLLAGVGSTPTPAS